MLGQPNIQDFPVLAIFDDSSDGVALACPGPWRLVYVNSTLAKWLDIAPNDLSGMDVDKVFPSAEPQTVSETLERIFEGGESRANIVRALVSPNGEKRCVEVRLRRIVLGGTPHVSMVVRDLDATTQHESVVSVVGRDPLTGLADRSVLFARISALLRGGRVGDSRFAVLFIDLNEFKQVNDAHGHLAGDRVLAEVARRLAGCVRARDLIVRFGGDEFVALVEGLSGMSEIQPVLDRIDAVLARPIGVADGEVTLSASVGVAEASLQHERPEDLLQEADRAMYASKQLPR